MASSARWRRSARRREPRARSKDRTAKDAIWTASDPVRAELESTGDKAFRGYDTTKVNTQILAIFDSERQEVPSLNAGQDGYVALTETPFYLEAGGQVSDVGTIAGPRGEARVTGSRAHRELAAPARRPRHQRRAVARDLVTAEVSSGLRDATRRNHTATHLLHAALRQVLGHHVKQAGSLVAPDRLRFDFVHVSAVTREQLLEIERIVNEQILRNTAVQTDVKNTQEAIAAGAMALFGEKYGDQVRVVSVPGFSVELCGGTHVRATGDIGLFAIVSEGGVAAGVRRIEAITGLDSLTSFQRQRDELGALSAALNARPGELAARISALQDENKRLARELQQAKMKAALAPAGARIAEGDVAEVAGVKLSPASERSRQGRPARARRSAPRTRSRAASSSSRPRRMARSRSSSASRPISRRGHRPGRS